MKEILIIGGVAAGATAAARARRLDKNARITMLEAGPDVSFANCGLPYYIGGDIKSRSKLILQSPESFKDQYDVTVHTMTEAVSIDREARTVTARNHQSGAETVYSYDKLILSQGGKPFIPGLEGADREHVFSLWTLEDMDRIHGFLEEKKPKSAVVVGGGFIGLEMAEALRKRGLEVSVVEMAPHVMPLMEGEVAGYIQKEMQARRIGIYTGRSVTAIGEDKVALDNGSTVNAEMVLLSVGVRPTLQLAKDTGLEIGAAGGLAVNEYLETSDSHILAGGDMAEIEHSVSGARVRVPLAGPANRQGRIAATNALAASSEEKLKYRGAQGTSIVRVFDAVAGSTGLNMKQAIAAGLDAQAIVVRKENHTSYYPGSSLVAIHLVYNRSDGKILGAQVYGDKGADKRLDVLSTSIAAGLTVDDLGELDLAYAPPFGSANDPVNMSGFVARNRIEGYSPSLTAAELESFVADRELALVDIRDYFIYQKDHIQGSANLSAERVLGELNAVPKDTAILIIDENGKTAHRVVRQLLMAGYENAIYLSGGYPSLEYLGRAGGLKIIQLPLALPEDKGIEEGGPTESVEEEVEAQGFGGSGRIVIDVRTPEEFEMGAYPSAVNIPLDEIPQKIEELGDKDREIIVYCASGARSAYAVRMLAQAGFTRTSNGGGLMQMMASA